MQLWLEVLATCAWRQVSGERGSCACVQYGGCRTCANTSITTPTDHSCLSCTPAGDSTKPSVVTQTTCNKDYGEHYTHLLLFCCSANSVPHSVLSSPSVQQIYFDLNSESNVVMIYMFLCQCIRWSGIINCFCLVRLFACLLIFNIT